MIVLYNILQILYILLNTIGYSGNDKLAGIPVFFLLFIMVFMIYVLDFNNIKKYYNNSFIYFFGFGFLCVLFSLIGGHSLLFNIPLDKSYIFRQSYFLVYLAIGIPVFAESINYGLFQLFINNLKTFFLVSLVFFDDGIILAIILLICMKNRKVGFFIFCSYIFSYYFLTEVVPMQNLLLHALLIIYFITNMNLNFKFIYALLVIIIFSAYFVSENLINVLTILDNNVGWRLGIWTDNIKSTVNDTFLLGHGFGTSYFASEGREPGDYILQGLLTRSNYAAETLRSYTLYQAEFVLGQHNSIINIFYRMGIIGLLLFFNLILSILKQMNQFVSNKEAKYIMIICLIFIGVNVGLESPGYATDFIFLFGIIRYLSYKYYLKLFLVR